MVETADPRAAGGTEEVAAPSADPGRAARWGRWGRSVHRGRAFDVVVGVGLVTYGIVYLLVAVIAARIAVTGQHAADSPYAALDEMAHTVAGEVLLWLTVFGLVTLTAWRVLDIVWRRSPVESWLVRMFGRTGSAVSGIGYLALAVSAVRVAVEGHGARDGTTSPPGPSLAVEHREVRIIVFVAGIVVLAVAAASVYRGVRTRFREDLKDGTARSVVRLGQVGHVGRGVTFAIVGGLLVWSAVGRHIGAPDEKTLFRLVNLSPSGGFLLVLKAIGLGLFGTYCLAWAANRRR